MSQVNNRAYSMDFCLKHVTSFHGNPRSGIYSTFHKFVEALINTYTHIFIYTCIYLCVRVESKLLLMYPMGNLNASKSRVTFEKTNRQR